jgi:protein-disulfide isomerase
MKDVLPQYRDAVRVAYLNFPLPGHPWARSAAEAMACIGAQSPEMFWRLHDYLFDHQSEIKPNSLDAKIAEQMGRAKDQGLDEPDFHACLDGKRGAALVDEDLEVGWTHDVSATPTLYINGERIEGAASAAALKAVIDRQLALAAEPPQR